MRVVPAVVRTGAAACALFAICGYAPACALVRGTLAPYRPLLVLPLGAAVSSLVLTVLGLFHVPLKVALLLVICLALVSDLRYALRQRREPARRDPEAASARAAARVALPLALAVLVALIALIPMFRTGFATVIGQNGDAVLVVGSAEVIEHAPPTASRLDLPINRIPLLWRSKYPIYFALAATATIANEDPIKAFATLSALMLALTALGFFALARYVLRAPPWLAALAMFLLPLDRIVMYVTIHPYYNELWGQFTLPFILLTGWHYLVSPGRRSAALFAVFVVLGLLAYPLMLPFPLFFLLGGFWIRWRRLRAAGARPGWISELRLPRPRARPLLWIPVGVIAIPVALVLIRGFLEKTLSAFAVLAPWTSLANWHGNSLGFLPWPHFVGMPGTNWLNVVAFALVCVLALFALTRIEGDARWAAAAMVLATGLIALYFRLRAEAELFFFKDMAFLGPYLLLLALIGLGSLARAKRGYLAALGLAGIAAALVLVPISAAREIDGTYEFATRWVLQLSSWDRALPPHTSVRIDVPPNGIQLWTMYMFKDHPLSSTKPLGGFFPYPTLSRKADYVIAERNQPRPTDASGTPLLSNGQFELWRMNPAVPGPDLSSRHLIDINKVTIGS